MNWLSRLWPKALPPAARLEERQDVAIVRTQARPSWDQSFSGFINPFFKIPHAQNLYLLEQIPALIPSVGSAMRVLTQLVGCPKVVSENKAAAEEAMEWWENLRVNRTGTGGGLWFAGHVKDHLLYGRSHAEVIPTARYNEVLALQQLHTRTIEMRPRSGYGVDLVQVQPFFSFDGKVLDQDLILTTIHDYQQDNPHGCSIICNLPRVSEILNRMLESLAATWERFGTPTFFVNYRPAKEISDPNGTKGAEVVASAMTGLQDAMLAKANNQTRDFGAAGDFDIQILGAQGEALDIAVPGRMILEEITSVFGLPSWMLGKHWSTTERLSENEAKLIGENVAEIRLHLLPSLRYLFTLRQLLVGRPFDFTLDWDAPSLIDAQGQATAEKMQADADAAQLKYDLELARLGILDMWQIAERHVDELKGKDQAEIERRLPRLLAEPPMPMLPAGPGGGQPGEDGQPQRPNVPFGGARSLTYSDGLLVKSNGRH